MKTFKSYKLSPSYYLFISGLFCLWISIVVLLTIKKSIDQSLLFCLNCLGLVLLIIFAFIIISNILDLYNVFAQEIEKIQIKLNKVDPDQQEKTQIIMEHNNTPNAKEN